MTRWLRSTTILTGFLLGSALYAQEPGAPAPAGFLGQMDATYVGKVGGLDAWSVQDLDILMVALPNNSGYVSGYAFDLSGEDIGAEATGTEAVDVWQSFGIEKPAGSADAGGEAATDATQTAAEETSGSNPLLSPSDSQALITEALSATATLVEGRSEEEQKQMMIDLIQELEAAQTPEAFRIALLEWREKVTGETILPDALKSITDDDAGKAESLEEPGGETAGLAAQAEPEATPDNQGKADSAIDIIPASIGTAAVTPPWAKPASEATIDVASDDKTRFLDDLRRGGFWFSIGQPDAPAIYMIADPACPYCARAIQSLQDAVTGGRLQLRILLAPLVSERSAGLVAAVLKDENPGMAYWNHALDYAKTGSSDLKLVEFSSLPASFQAGVQRNYDFVAKNGLPGVPFFAWATSDGPKFLSGVAGEEKFDGALTDSFGGEQAQ
jgi:hypothetical protein